MKKTIFILLFSTIAVCVSADITFRSPEDNLKTLNYDIRTRHSIKAQSHNIIISPEQYNTTNITLNKPTKGYDKSYLSIETQKQSTSHLSINGNNENYYHRYALTNSSSQIVTYNNYTGMKPYNISSEEPFSEENKVNVSATQNAWGGPPTEGPVGDAFLPLLILAGLYIFIQKKQN